MALKKIKKEKAEKNTSKKSVDVKAIIGKLASKGKDSAIGMKGLENKNGISSQIQSRIGKSVIAVLLVIAVIATIMVNNILPLFKSII